MIRPSFRRRAGKVYHVNNNGGSNSNTGLAASKAFSTIQKAADVSAPGDTVLIHAGNGYTTSIYMIDIETSGTADAWITYMAFPGDRPVLTTTSASDGSASFNNVVINIYANYIAIDGLVLDGTTSTGLTEGISFGFYNYTNVYHHLKVTNCEVKNMGGDGIAPHTCDYVTISGCVVHGCGSRQTNGPVGIHPGSFVAFDSAPGYHNYIVNNICYNNMQQAGTIIDGEGILVDDMRNSVNGGTAYTQKTLVANNLCFYNGSCGVGTFRSSNVDIVHNTCWGNQRNLSNGEISITGAPGTDTGVYVYNNVVYADTGKTQLQNQMGADGHFDYNCRYGGVAGATGAHDVAADPQFVNPASDAAAANFHLQSGSPARNAGTASYGVANDLAGVARPIGGGYRSEEHTSELQ